MKAQIIQQYTMWNQNHYLLNPAAAGNSDHFEVAIGFRQQWAGVSDAPQSYYATGHSILNKPKSYEKSAIYTSKTTNAGTTNKRFGRPYVKHALGGKLNAGENGAFKKTEALLTYSIHLPIKNDLYLSFGLTGGLSNFGFNESKASVLIDNDPTYNSYASSSNSNIFNANAGTYLYSDKFFVGYSARQIMQNQLKLADVSDQNDPTSLEMEHYIMGGYNFDLNNDIRFTPNVLLKQVATIPSSYEINGTITYKKSISAGLTYRSEDAIAILLGLRFNHLIKAGYSFDYNTSEIKEQSSGSHEIFIGLTIF
jgi:type IX secretion system PorP/SprF family membrane protein